MMAVVDDMSRLQIAADIEATDKEGNKKSVPEVTDKEGNKKYIDNNHGSGAGVKDPAPVDEADLENIEVL